MLLPIGDSPNPQRFTAWVNWALILANVAIYALISLPLSLSQPDPGDPMVAEYLDALLPRLGHRATAEQLAMSISNYDLFVFAHGYKPGRPELNDLFSSMFLHGGFMHLAGNMLFLWIFGDNVEHRIGRIKYLIVYLATGVCGTLGFAVFAQGSLTPLVGASGAISGALGLYFVMFPRNKVKVLIAFFPVYVNVILVPCRWVLGFFVVFENLIPFLITTQSSVAYGAHLGGFIAGFGVAYLGERFAWQIPKQADRPRPRRVKVEGTRSSALDAVRAALASGDRATAARGFSALSNADVFELTPGEAAVLALALDDAGQAVAASSVLRRCISQKTRWPGRELARAYLAFGLLRLRQGQATSAYQHLLTALDLDPDPETRQAAEQALSSINVYRQRS